MRPRSLLVVALVAVGAVASADRTSAQPTTPEPVDATVSNVAVEGSPSHRRLFTAGAPQPAGAVGAAAGYGFTCAVTASGGAQCWGDNSYAQLGDGTMVSRGRPADVSGLTSGVVAVAAASASEHACALTTGGGVKCWGDNYYGQLGDGSTTRRLTPADVVGLSGGVSAVAAGSSGTCAVTDGGGVKCWGDQVGDGTTTRRSTRVDVTGLASGVKAVVVGSSHACALEDRPY
jgi:alpha-tubulin suppressor-like RCC1 family protein